MARPQADAKACYYPAHPTAIQRLALHLQLRPPNAAKKVDTCLALDPCCGQGVAIQALTAALGIPEEQVYTVELDGERSTAAQALMPRHHHLGPAGFAGTQITSASFGLVYLNPPFGSELCARQRQEVTFTEIATRKLVPKGILTLVCPFKALHGNKEFCELIDANYEDVCVYKFPDGEDAVGNAIRPYHEITVIGKKRSAALPRDQVETLGVLHRMMMPWRYNITLDSLPELGTVQPLSWSNGTPSSRNEGELRVWEIPPSRGPNVFKKTAFTPSELESLLANSPLNDVLKEVVIPPPAEPPLPLDKGHLGLILASGMLDGTVAGPHGVHVVRGSSHKVEYHNKEASKNEENPDSGAVTTKDVFSQRPVTVIRTVEQDGCIRTFSSDPCDETEDDDEADAA